MGYEKNGSTITWNSMVQRCCKKIRTKVLGWYKYYIFFTKATLFISGLVVCHAYVEYAVLGVFITYLKNNWDQNLPKAAEIANFQEGLSTVLKIVVAFVSDAYSGRFKMVIYSTAIFVAGLVILCVEAWLQINNMGLLWVALLLVSIGKAGRSAPLKAFMADQLWSNELTPKEAEEQKESRQSVWWNISWFLGSMMALFLGVPWNILCLISVIAMFVAWLCFLSGFAFYNCIRPTGSSLSNVMHVIKVAILKRKLSYPLSPSQFYGNDSDEILLTPAVSVLRWLDKAAIVEPASICPEKQQDKEGQLPNLCPEQQEKEGRLCTVAEVREVKLLLTMVPLWTTFLVYSLVDALGSTLFLEQADTMDGHIGIIGKVPSEFFLMIKSFISFTVSYFYIRNQRHVRLMIGLGMVWSILSCSAAAIVELQRTDDSISTAFWVIPQYIFLGLMEGYAINGLNEFFDAHVSESMRIYGPEFTDCVLGIGKFISIILIIICKDWFGNDVDSSHLDRYYGMIAILNVLNLIAFGFIASQYGNIGEMVSYELEEVIVDRSSMLASHWRNRYRYWSTCSPSENETLLRHRPKKSPHRLITLTGCGTELNHHIMNNEDEQSDQLKTRYPERWFHHSEKLFCRSFTAIGCESNQSQEMIRRRYRFAPKTSLEASILMSKGWGPGANYSLLSRSKTRKEHDKEE